MSSQKPLGWLSKYESELDFRLNLWHFVVFTAAANGCYSGTAGSTSISSALGSGPIIASGSSFFGFLKFEFLPNLSLRKVKIF